MHNLLVSLDAKTFGTRPLAAARRAIERAGFKVARADDAFYAWIDAEFGGTWSSEAFAGKNIVVKKGDRYAGFATYDPQNLNYLWLRRLAKEPGVGVFGPFGVTPEYRGSPLGANLLKAALASLRELGYKRALIGAVGHPKLVEYYAKHSGAHIAESYDLDALRKKRRRTVVFASGNGTNFQSVIDGAGAGTLPLDLRLLVCNNPNAQAITRARIAGIRSAILPWDRARQARWDYDAQLRETVRTEDPELILLLGWMHVLDAGFLAEFPEAINIHPAFLPLDQTRDEVTFPDGSRAPAFRGTRAVRDALQWGCRWTGATAHRAGAEADRGPVLVRKLLSLLPGDTEESALSRLHPLEHRVLAGGIIRWLYES